MLQKVEVKEKKLADYAPIVGEETVEEIKSLAKRLKGARVAHVNSTAFGGGVAEILQNLVPLMRDVGLEAEWRVIQAEEEFFQVTKAFHNALQGASLPLTDNMKEIYLRYNRLNASAFEGRYDYVIIHDPQPAALLYFHGRAEGERWLWRCHIDTSTPNLSFLTFLKPYIELYDAGIFTLEQFFHSDLKLPRLAIIPPSIDPLSPKNNPRSLEESRAIVSRFGIDVNRPLLTQVSRFDPWKDPLGVIDSYRMIKMEIPQVQLALLGSMASDDPEGWEFYERTLCHAGEDYDIHILHNLHGVGNLEVGAFQHVSDVVIQKSIREGFGLVVTEALWKGKPVVGGRAGGIPLQIIEGQTGYLVESALLCAERAYYLLTHPEERERMGRKAREHVRANFLITRHLRDYLKLLPEL